MPKSSLLKHRFISGWIGALYALGLLFGCQTGAYVSEPPADAFKIKRILVLPFNDANLIAANAVDTRCPVCGAVFLIGDVAAGAADFLTDQSVDLLKRHTDYQIVVERISSDALAALYPADQTADQTRKLLADKGRANDADVVMVGFVYRFKERVGKGYGVESPASVAFGIHLIRVVDSRTIWSARFDETQESLGDNLFRLGSFISRGGRWLTAEELATSGLEEIFKKFPKR